MSGQNLFISAFTFSMMFFAIGCEPMGTQVIKDLQDAGGEMGKAGKVVISSTADEWGTDAYTINTAAVQDDTLSINVSYSGETPETHVFTLVAEPVFLESFPVQLHVSLAHNANGDIGEASITKDYHFNLTPIKEVYQKGYKATEGTIVLRLKDAPASELFYDF